MSALKKIVIIGPESTGKSTLSAALAKELNTVWVPEYARQYLETIGSNYQPKDLLQIAKGQLLLEEKMLPQAHNFLICDTDLYVLKVWSEHSFGTCNDWILQQIATRVYDYYILTGIDFPWHPDPLREHGEANMRHYFFRQYLDIVSHTSRPFTIAEGTETARLKQCMQAIRLWEQTASSRS